MRRDSRPDWSTPVQTTIPRIVSVGFCAGMACLVAFGVWAFQAPLAGATIANGSVMATGRNHVIQHLEGGIVKQIHVAEGQHVSLGDPLITLDDSAIRSQRNRTEKAIVGLLIRIERLRSEREDNESFEVPSLLTDRATSAGLLDLVEDEIGEFETGLLRHVQERSILTQRILSIREEVEGLRAQLVALKSQEDIVTDEALRKERLLEQGLTNRSEYTSLIRANADLVGRIGEVSSRILSSATRIVEIEEQIASASSRRSEEASAGISEARQSIADLEEQLASSTATLQRSVIRASSDGALVSLEANAIGSVVSPGAKVAEILPTGASLMAEARILPSEINDVRVGQTARIRFSSLSRMTPEIESTVIYVSADRLIDPRTGEHHYLARLRLDDLGDRLDETDILPGIPLEILVDTDMRTFASYLAKPITDSFALAFRQR